VGRAVALDCEMTGNEPQRLIEVGAVEMVDGRPTGRTFHARVKPPTPISPFATKVHGLTAEDLAGEPEAAAVLPALLAFIDAAPLVCHEARCDRDVLGRELALAGLPPLADHIHCTAILSRRINHRQPMGLNALCDRFHIDRSVRVHHGALTDAALLAQVLPALIAETTALA